MTFPDLIETKRLSLRRPQASDAGPLSLYAGDIRVAQFLEHVPHPYPDGAAEAFIARSLSAEATEHVWVMDALKIDGPEFIGVIGVKKSAHLQLGYWVGPPFWNTGYASEAAQAVVGAVRATGAERLTARVVDENEASSHVLVNAGFRETGKADFFVVAAGRALPHRLFTLAFAGAAQ